MNAKETILVVDDNVRMLAAVQRILESNGYLVLTAYDGLAALQIMQERTPHLILADIAMPRMNGYQLHERVRQNPDWALIPFIFLTGRAMDSDIRYGKEIGVDDYLVKPIEPEDLLATVQGKLKRARQWSLRRGQPEATSEKAPLVVGALYIDPAQRRARLHGRLLTLSAREFTVLEHLARNATQVISPQILIKLTHDLDLDNEEASTLLRPLIRSLRRKLGYPAGEVGCIETVRGLGYRLLPPAA
ncbi:MAG: response regulator transcription factor [Anaerolineae bacterium]